MCLASIDICTCTVYTCGCLTKSPSDCYYCQKLLTSDTGCHDKQCNFECSNRKKKSDCSSKIELTEDIILTIHTIKINKTTFVCKNCKETYRMLVI